MRIRLHAWLGIALAAGLAGYPATLQSQDVPQVTAQEIAAGVWRIDGAIDVILAHVGADGLLMVDTGYPFAEAGVREELDRIAGTSRADVLINTHWHHAFANHLYGGERIIAHDDVPRRMVVSNLMGGRVIDPMPVAGVPNETFADSIRLRFNGEDVTIVHLPRAHTDTDAVVLFETSNVVLAGDLFVPSLNWTDLDSGGEVRRHLAAVDWMVERIPEDAVIVPGHGPNATHGDLVRWRDMLNAAFQEVTTAVARGETLRQIQTRGLEAVEGWDIIGVPERLFVETLYRAAAPGPDVPGVPSTEFRNGLWWEEGRFVSKTMYASRGVLRSSRPEGAVSVVDLNGGWVVPPMAEAHTHAFGQEIEEASVESLENGVFYAMVQDPLFPVTPSHRTFVEDAATVDLSFTQGVVTPMGGVVADMYRMFLDLGMFGTGTAFSELDGNVVFTMDSVDEVERRWPALRRRNDDFIKVIVAFSDELETRRADPERYGANPGVFSAKPGVSPDVLRRLTELAHRDGLRVSAHIETAADFRLAAETGVDLIAHMPAAWQIGEGTGYGEEELEPWMLRPEDASVAARNGVAVITTVRPRQPDDPRQGLFDQVHRHNLGVLGGAGVQILIGSDGAGADLLAEARYLESLGVMDRTEIFTLLTTLTPRVLFPDRRIGHLRDGWEASFLVLEGDPTTDLGHLDGPSVVVKGGHVLIGVTEEDGQAGWGRDG